MKSIWHPVFFGMLLMSTPLMAQMPGPPPPPLPHLSADQKHQVNDIRQAFEEQHKANVERFEEAVKSILTPSQVARFNQLQQDRIEFENGMARARERLQQDAPPPGAPPPLALHELKLTPEQMGEVHVFHQALMEADHQGMEAMRQKTMALLTPEQQAQMPPPPPPGMPPPPPPPPPPGDD